jgi:hypothetical protein
MGVAWTTTRLNTRLIARLVTVMVSLEPLAAAAQWSADPAQAGAQAYCETINQGLTVDQAEQRANQAMAEILLTGSDPLSAGLRVNSPALQERWRYLVDSLCPESSPAADAMTLPGL